MALHLKRITWPYECVRCSITKKLLIYGDYYYEDDEDGLIIDYIYYSDRKLNARKEEAFNNANIPEALDEFSYQAQMRESERQFLESTVFDRPLAVDERFKKDKEGTQ